MKKMMFVVAILVASFSVNGMNDVSKNSAFLKFKVSKDLSYFRPSDGNKKIKVVALYRGVNFCSDVFSSNKQENYDEWKRYIDTYTPGINVLESFHTQKTFQKLSKFLKDTPKKITREDVRIHQILNLNFMFQYILRRNKKKNNMTLRSNNYVEYHKDYSNNYSNGERSFDFNQYGTQFEANPFLSFSKGIEHAIKYAYGIDKKYSRYSPLTANFNHDGSPKNDMIGVVQVVFIKKEDLKKLGVCDVNREIGKPGQRKFYEKEVSLDGYAFPENFVFQCEANLPNLSKDSSHWNSLNISDTIRKNWLSGRKKTDYTKKYLMPYLEEAIKNEVRKLAEANNIELVSLENL